MAGCKITKKSKNHHTIALYALITVTRNAAMNTERDRKKYGIKWKEVLISEIFKCSGTQSV